MDSTCLSRPRSALLRIIYWAGLVGLTLGMLSQAAASSLRVIDADAHYPESPLWHDGRLFYVEYSANNIKTWDNHHVQIYWHRDHCGPAAVFAFQDHLLVACTDENALVELDKDAKVVRVIKSDDAGNPLTGPNDFCSDGHGGVYFTDSGLYDIKAPITGTVIHLTPDRKLTLVANTIHYSNGLVVANDGTHLLVAEMLAGRILSFPVEQGGQLGLRTVWARMDDLASRTPNEDAYNGPDGVKLGPDKLYYVAQNGSGRVLVVNDERRTVRTIDVPTPYVTNIGFGTHGEVYISGAFEQWKEPYHGAVYEWTP
ncbi:MAG: SMP-30/gluconolactonase/LRE family protein [Steroidobacteraceae bacterium]